MKFHFHVYEIDSYRLNTPKTSNGTGGCSGVGGDDPMMIMVTLTTMMTMTMNDDDD